MKRICSIYRSPRRNEMYLYVLKSDALERVPVELVRYEGMTHEFFKMGGLVPDVAKAHADAASALRRCLGIED